MKNSLLIFFLLPIIFLSCSEETEVFKKEFAVGAQGRVTENLDFKQLGNDNSTYYVYIYKGSIDITSDIIKNPSAKAFKSSKNMFFEILEDGTYTILVEATLLNSALGATRYYKMVGYKTISYKNTDVAHMERFYFTFNKEKYEIEGSSYISIEK